MPPVKEFARKVDEMLLSLYPPGNPGAALIVIRRGKVLLRKAYGMANLELRVRVKPGMVFRLGSITKQFTAVGILMLQEQGKLDVQDEITRHLPDYPTGGRRITVEHLLTHTSGVKSYTDLPEWLPLWRKDMSLEELIALFRDRPLDFDPGEQWRYNNSGYILLGAILEKVSGMSYAAFVQEYLFDAAGMKHTCYDQTDRLLPGRVAGYTRGNEGYLNAPYLSMTQPHAAGALASTVDDLALWDEALRAGKLLPAETLAAAFRPYMLRNGESTGYGYGWAISEHGGLEFHEHGGGINGFSTGAVSVPAEGIYVALLTNLDNPETSPDDLAFRIAAMATGHPVRTPKPLRLPVGKLAQYEGVYQVAEGEERVVTVKEGKLFSQRTGGMKVELIPIAEDEFLVRNSQDRFRFGRDKKGGIREIRVLRRLGPAETSPRTKKPLPAQVEGILLEPGLVERFPGSYEIAPGFALELALEGGALFAQAPGQEKLKLLAETPQRLRAEEVDVRFDFEFDPEGRFVSGLMTQGPQKLPLKKVA